MTFSFLLFLLLLLLLLLFSLEFDQTDRHELQVEEDDGYILVIVYTQFNR